MLVNPSLLTQDCCSTFESTILSLARPHSSWTFGPLLRTHGELCLLPSPPSGPCWGLLGALCPGSGLTAQALRPLHLCQRLHSLWGSSMALGMGHLSFVSGQTSTRGERSLLLAISFSSCAPRLPLNMFSASGRSFSFTFWKPSTLTWELCK